MHITALHAELRPAIGAGHRSQCNAHLDTVIQQADQALLPQPQLDCGLRRGRTAHSLCQHAGQWCSPAHPRPPLGFGCDGGCLVFGHGHPTLLLSHNRMRVGALEGKGADADARRHCGAIDAARDICWCGFTWDADIRTRPSRLVVTESLWWLQEKGLDMSAQGTEVRYGALPSRAEGVPGRQEADQARRWFGVAQGRLGSC